MVVIKDGLIDYAGPEIEIEPEGERIDMKGKIVMPGLVNTHTHSPAALFRGFADDLFLMDWLQHYMWPMEKNLTAQFAYDGASLSYLEFLKNGMTTNVDMWYYADSLAQAAMRIGLRAVIAAGIFTWSTPESDHSLRDADDFVAKYRSTSAVSYIYPCYGPHDAYSCSREILRETAKLAAKRDTIIHAHISETQQNNEELFAKEGVSPTRYMQREGIFDQHVLGAHCIYLSDEDIDIFHESGACVSYNPVSNLKLCDGILPLQLLMKGNVGVSLGIDGAQSNNSLDLLADLKTGVLIQKMSQNDPTFFPARQAVRMVTIDGARAIGMENEIGSIEKGKLADIISLDTRDVNLAPCLHDFPEQIYSHITYSALGSNVSDVFVGGKQLLKDKKTLYLDTGEILETAQKASRILYEQWKNM